MMDLLTSWMKSLMTFLILGANSNDVKICIETMKFGIAFDLDCSKNCTRHS